MAGLIVLLSRDPAGVLRVGKTRVLLALVIRAHQRGAAPQNIIQMFGALELSDVFAVVAYCLAHPAEIDKYLQKCNEEADAVRREIESSQRPVPSKVKLLARATSKGMFA
jgi:uncharacterized protein (DUF433 family)